MFIGALFSTCTSAICTCIRIASDSQQWCMCMHFGFRTRGLKTMFEYNFRGCEVCWEGRNNIILLMLTTCIYLCSVEMVAPPVSYLFLLKQSHRFCVWHEAPPETLGPPSSTYIHICHPCTFLRLLLYTHICMQQLHNCVEFTVLCSSWSRMWSEPLMTCPPPIRISPSTPDMMHML